MADPLHTPSSPRRILITGGAGFIGSHTAELAMRAGHDVHILDRAQCIPSSNLQGFDATKVIAEDVTTKAAEDAAAALRADCILHLAAHVDARASLDNPWLDFETNVEGTIRMLEAARKSGVKTFVFASSAAVYGDTDALPIRESAPIAPLSPYGASKASAECFVRQYQKTYGIRTIILRYANVFGPRQALSGEAAVIPRFIHAAKEGLPLDIFGDGMQTRDFVFVEDVARANLFALTDPRAQEVYNVSGAGEVTIKELACMVINMTSSASAIRYLPEKKGDIRRSVLDNSRLLGALKGVVSAPFSSRLAETCAWYTS